MFTDRPTCIEYFLTRIHALVEALSLERFTLIGHSMGGFLSTHYMARHLHLVHRLILLSPAGATAPTTDE